MLGFVLSQRMVVFSVVLFPRFVFVLRVEWAIWPVVSSPSPHSDVLTEWQRAYKGSHPEKLIPRELFLTMARGIPPRETLFNSIPGVCSHSSHGEHETNIDHWYVFSLSSYPPGRLWWGHTEDLLKVVQVDQEKPQPKRAGAFLYFNHNFLEI